MEKLRTILEEFAFTEDERQNLTLAGAARLNPTLLPKLYGLELKQNDGLYVLSTATARSRVFNPTSVRHWDAIQIATNHDAGASAKYRLSDGQNDLWWHSNNWQQASSDDQWNTDTELSAGFAEFSPESRKLQLVVKLGSTSQLATPRVNGFTVVYRAKINSFIEDILLRTLVPALRAGLTFITTMQMKVPSPSSSTLEIGHLLDNHRFNITSLDSIFDYTSDPECLSNLASAYNNSTRTITLLSAIPSGHVAFVQLVVSPEVILETTGQDYIEAEKLPAVVIRNIRSQESSPLPRNDGITNKATGAGILVPAPYRFDLAFSILSIASGNADALRMAEAFVEFMDANQTLRSPGLDRRYRMRLLDELQTTTLPTLAGTYSAEATGLIVGILAHLQTAETSFGVRSTHFQVT